MQQPVQRRDRRASIAGFSLVEVALALLVVSVGLAAVFSLFPSGADSNRKAIQDTQMGLFADYVLNGFRHQAEEVTWDAVTDGGGFSISALGGTYAWSNPDPVYADQSGVRAITYRSVSDSAIEEMAFRYQLRIYPVAGRPNVKALVLNVWPGAYGVLAGTNVFYTEVYNYGG